MTWKDVLIIVLVFLSLGLSIFNFRATKETVNYLNNRIDATQDGTVKSLDQVFEELDWQYDRMKELGPILIKMGDRDIQTTKMLVVLAQEIKLIDDRVKQIEESVQQCLVQDEHLWYHLQQTRKTQNDLFGVLDKTQKVFEKHYHGPKPLLY